MLTDEDRERARQLAEGVSSTLKDDERKGYTAAARHFVAMLREDFGCSDETGAHVASLVVRLMGSIQRTPLQHVSDMVDANLTSYALAAGSLAGVYLLPEGDERERGGIESPADPADVPAAHPARSQGAGPYL